MQARKFFLSCVLGSVVCAAAASTFVACAEGAQLDDDDDSDAGLDGAAPDATTSSSSTSSSTSSGGSSGASSGGSSGSSSGGPVDCKLVINEVSAESSDWVELYNPAGCDDVELSSYELIYRAATGTNDTPLFEGDATTLAGGEYFVIGNGGDAPFVSGTTPLGAAGGQLALKDGSNSVDEVAYGSANGEYGEGDPAPATGSQSIQRIPDGTDTDDNSADFQVSAPTKGSSNE